jgi:hypothetical protein
LEYRIVHKVALLIERFDENFLPNEFVLRAIEFAVEIMHWDCGEFAFQHGICSKITCWIWETNAKQDSGRNFLPTSLFLQFKKIIKIFSPFSSNLVALCLAWEKRKFKSAFAGFVGIPADPPTERLPSENIPAKDDVACAGLKCKLLYLSTKLSSSQSHRREIHKIRQ